MMWLVTCILSAENRTSGAGGGDIRCDRVRADKMRRDFLRRLDVSFDRHVRLAMLGFCWECLWSGHVGFVFAMI